MNCSPGPSAVRGILILCFIYFLLFIIFLLFFIFLFCFFICKTADFLPIGKKSRKRMKESVVAAERAERAETNFLKTDPSQKKQSLSIICVGLCPTIIVGRE